MACYYTLSAGPGASTEIVAESWAPKVSGGLCRPPPPIVARSLAMTCHTIYTHTQLFMSDKHFNDSRKLWQFIPDIIRQPICLSVLPHIAGRVDILDIGGHRLHHYLTAVVVIHTDFAGGHLGCPTNIGYEYSLQHRPFVVAIDAVTLPVSGVSGIWKVWLVCWNSFMRISTCQMWHDRVEWVRCRWYLLRLAKKESKFLWFYIVLFERWKIAHNSETR